MTNVPGVSHVASSVRPVCKRTTFRLSPGRNAATAATLIELPGIEAAYNTVELRTWFASQHGTTWENMSGDEDVLTTVSTPICVSPFP